MGDYPLKLPTETTIGRDGQEANTRLINGYAEQMGVDQDGKAPYVIYAAPGLTRWDSGNFIGIDRGSIALDASNLIYLLGNQLVKFDAAGAPTVYGAIVGSGRAIMARNRAGTPQIGIVTQSYGYYVLTGTSLVQPTEANLPPPNSITYLKGNFFFGIPDGRMFASPQESATGISALSTDTANSDAGGIVRVFAHAGYLYAFGPRSFEIWQYTGDTPFPIAPTQQYINLGLLSASSLAETDKGLIWVDHKGMVRFGQDGGAIRISTHSVERAIGKLTLAEKTTLVGSICTFEGHECYVLASDSWTWMYDIYMQRWYQRKSYGQDRWLASAFTWFNDEYICGSNVNGRLYKLDMSSFKEDSTNYVLEVWCENSHNFPNAALTDALNVDVVSGVGSLDSDETTDPHLIVDFSDDGGKTFQGERLAPLGAMGNYRQLIRTGCWGRLSQKGRIWRFRASASVLRCIIQASLRGRPVL